MKENKFEVLTGLIILVCIMLLGLFKYQQHKINQEQVYYQQKLNKAKKTLATIDETLREKGTLKAKQGNQVEQQAALQTEVAQEITISAQELFKILYTFSDSKQYYSRATKATDLVSTNVLADQKIFGSDKDTSGNSYIDTLRLQASFKQIQVYTGLIDNNEVQVLADVSYEASQGDYQPGKQEEAYQLTYNTEKKKFTQIEKIGTVDISQDDD